MELPGGLPMADLGDDRDRLRLDRLHVPLGPVLPDWPPGLVVRTVLQGDVIQEASADVLDAGSGRPFWRDAHPAARELDGLARFLGLRAGPMPRQPSNRPDHVERDRGGRVDGREQGGGVGGSQVTGSSARSPTMTSRAFRDQVRAGCPGRPCGCAGS
jgi:hypothetical protein